MWGNALGWTISAIIVVATAAGVSWLNHNMEGISGRSQFSLNGDNGDAIALPVAPATLLPTMTDPTDAGPIYRRAVELYLKDPFTYGKFARSGRARDIDDVPAIKSLIEASNCATGKIFIDNPAEIVSFAPEKPALEALRTLGDGAIRAGMLIQQQSPAEAIKLFAAAFALGDKLYQERLTYEELDAGLNLMAQGSSCMRDAARTGGDMARAEECKRFDEARAEYFKTRIQPVQRVIVTIDQATLEYHAGDVFYFARHAQDRMWRAESILKLGRYRFNAGRVGDQRNAIRTIRDLLANDPDPVIRAAAIAARDLTEEQYRMLR